jgi:hypothetical protein
MNLYYDLRLRRFVTTPGLDDALDSLEFKAGDTEEIVLQFGRSPDASAPSSVITSPTWTAESLSAGATISIGIKASGDYHDGDLLSGTSSFTEDTEAKTYTFDLNLNTTEINTALNRDDADDTNDTAAIEDALFEMTFKSSPTAGVRSSIDDVTVTIKHDVLSGSEGTPASAATPSDYALTADTIQFLPAVSSQTGGTAADFDSVETVNRSAGEAFAFFDDDASSVFRVYELVAGTDAESAPETIRPDDFAASTNEKIFKLRLTIPTGTPLQADGSVAGTSRQELSLLNLTDATELTIATGAVTATQGFHTVDTEADAASDDLATISGGENGDVLVIRPADGTRTVVVKHGTGNIKTFDGADITLDESHKIVVLYHDGTNWNAPGGGSSLPVLDTQTIVKDPADETKLLRFDAGVIPTGTTRIAQMCRADAMIGPKVIERSYYAGTSLSSGSPEDVWVCRDNLRFLWWDGEIATAGSVDVTVDLKKNGTTVGNPLTIATAAATGSKKYGTAALDIDADAGDAITIEVTSNGSGGSGSAAQGALKLAFWFAIDPD